MPQRAAAKAAAAAAPPAPSMSAVSTASTLPGQSTHSGVQPPQAQSGHQPAQSGLQSQASLGSQAGGQSSPMDIGAGAASDASSKRGSNAAANMPSLQPGRLGLGLGLKPTANTGVSYAAASCKPLSPLPFPLPKKVVGPNRFPST